MEIVFYDSKRGGCQREIPVKKLTKQKSNEESSFYKNIQHRVSSTVTSRLHDEMDRGDSSDVCSIFVAQRSCNTVATIKYLP